MRNITTAPKLARKLVSRAPFLRAEITRASKAEENGTAGATVERERLTASFAREHKAVEDAIVEADAAARDFDFAHIILKSKTDLGTQRGPISELAAMLVRMSDGEPHCPSLDTLTEIASGKTAVAAEQAKVRLEDAEPELRSVALLAQYRAVLPSVKFDHSHPKVVRLKHAFFDASQIAAKRRKTP
ncbi:hypothetical protein [uncultured Shimia sp.]|uniref:hypothetical protein n=1 Tax=uncultured Shimia sp. TaxID=573152 RepID=UPI0026242CA7|nr:hypothetical protein [uncultured Shimia sp.]